MGIYHKKTAKTPGNTLAFCERLLYNIANLDNGGIVVGEAIAVLSGKGGTGKTSVCAGIALALAQQGKTVLCIDCDIGLRNLDIALGVSDISSISFMEVAEGGYPLEAATIHPVFPGLKFLTAPMNCRAETVDQQAFWELLRDARKNFDYIFLDAPAGLDAGFCLAAKAADRVILVTGPDPASIRDAREAADKLELMGKQNVRLIVNRISKKMAEAMNLTVDDVMDRAGLPLLGIVPEDPNVVLAAAFRQPLLGYTRKGAAAACKRIAKRLQGYTVPILRAVKR